MFCWKELNLQCILRLKVDFGLKYVIHYQLLDLFCLGLHGMIIFEVLCLIYLSLLNLIVDRPCSSSNHDIFHITLTNV